jgi:hypothetical protein
MTEPSIQQLLIEVDRLRAAIDANMRVLEETAHRRRLAVAEVRPGQRGDGLLHEPALNFTKAAPMKLFGRIQRQYHDGPHLIVEGAVDTDGESSATEWAAALKSTIPLREMHQQLAAGKITAATVLPDGRIFVRAVVIDPTAVQKTAAALYRGLSIAASRSSGVLRVSEISLVDRPMQSNEMWRCRPAEELAKLYDGNDSKMAGDQANMTVPELIKRLGEAGLTIAPIASGPITLGVGTPQERRDAEARLLAMVKAARPTTYFGLRTADRR